MPADLVQILVFLAVTAAHIVEETAAGEAIENDKMKAENAKAVKMRNRALESLGAREKQKQNEEEENGARKSESKKWRRHSSIFA